MKPRILQFICPTGYYGAERWITALLKSMDANLFESHLCMTLEAESATDIIQHCENHCHKIHTISMSSKFDHRVIKALVAVIREYKIDIIHTHGYKSDIIGVIAGKIAGVKTVCTPHGFENTSDIKLRSYMWIGGKAFHFFDVVCPLSPQIESDLASIYRVKRNKTQLINNGVDLYEVRNALAEVLQQEDNRPFTIGYIGQLISRKNISALIEAFALLKQSNVDARLVLIGDGDERANLENKAQALGVFENVSFLGFRHDRLTLLPTFDTFALTSSLEGIPRCLMEAMAAKVCVTAFDIPGVDQLITHENTGLLVPFGDTAALAEQWNNLIDNKDLKHQLAEAGQAYVELHYSSEAMAEQYQNLYLSLISKGAYHHA